MMIIELDPVLCALEFVLAEIKRYKSSEWAGLGWAGLE